MANVKTVYLVDYENVGETGLEGAEKLTDKDIVCIFTSQPGASLSFKTLSLLNHVDLRCFLVPQCKQSADMCISSFLGYLIKEHEGTKTNFVVISKDKDFASIIKFWSDNGLGSISRRAVLFEKASSNSAA